MKRALVVVALLALFAAYLHFLPPYFVLPPRMFTEAFMKAAPTLEHVADPAERILAERGRHLAALSACTDCHVPAGRLGPKWDRFMVGGMKVVVRDRGSFVARNLTPEPTTGIGKWTDAELERVLRSGIAPEGRAIYHRAMPWPIYANWTEEDRRAVIVFLRNLEPDTHTIPPPDPNEKPADPDAVESYYVGADYAGGE